MKENGLENMTVIGHFEVEKERLMRMNRKYAGKKRPNTTSYTEYEVLEIHNQSRPDWTRYIEEELESSRTSDEKPPTYG